MESDFLKLVQNSEHVVDKSLFIADFLEARAGVYFISRPPKWGKTVALSMLGHFLTARGGNRPAAAASRAGPSLFYLEIQSFFVQIFLK